MESISNDVNNYNVVQCTLTGISPLAVRKIFDRELHPVCLKSELSKERKKIQQLKNIRVLNQTQMDLLYPRGGIEPLSSTFDTSLMLCLLKHVANIDVYDQTPQPKDKIQSADLGRIRYYRNEFAHMNKSELSTESFNRIWTDLTEAIQRLGDQKCMQNVLN